MTANITDELSVAAVRTVPMTDGFTVTPNGGYESAPDWLDLYCGTCSWYAEHVSPRGGRFDPRPVTGHVARRTRRTPLPDLNQAAAAHACPPEVTAAARAARDARQAATATVPGRA